MQLDAVRSLKVEAAERVVGPARARAGALRSYNGPAFATRRLGGPQPSVALGVSLVGAGRDSYRLAVRSQARGFQTDYRLLAELQRLAAGEVDVRYIGKAMPQAATWQRDRHRPLRVGVSVAHAQITAGTIGVFPRHCGSGETQLLSNAHVLASGGLASRGDAILQPGPLDDGRDPADRIGGLADWVPLNTNGANFVDAAVCSLDAGVEVDRTSLLGHGRLKGLRADATDVDDEVFKIGRTTGLTRGRVTAIELDDLVVEMEELGPVIFNGQIEIEGTGSAGFSDGGDSGSLIFDRDGFGLGLLFAGSDQGGANGLGLTYANDLRHVLSALNLTLDV